VGRIGKESERAGNQAADDLDDHKKDDYPKRHEQTTGDLAGRFVVVLMVAVNHSLAVFRRFLRL